MIRELMESFTKRNIQVELYVGNYGKKQKIMKRLKEDLHCIVIPTTKNVPKLHLPYLSHVVFPHIFFENEGVYDAILNSKKFDRKTTTPLNIHQFICKGTVEERGFNACVFSQVCCGD